MNEIKILEKTIERLDLSMVKIRTAQSELREFNRAWGELSRLGYFLKLQAKSLTKELIKLKQIGETKMKSTKERETEHLKKYEVDDQGKLITYCYGEIVSMFEDMMEDCYPDNIKLLGKHEYTQLRVLKKVDRGLYEQALDEFIHHDGYRESDHSDNIYYQLKEEFRP